MNLAAAFDLVIFDLDGVVYVGTDPVDGAVEAIGTLRRAGTPVAYATNNASRSRPEVTDLLRGLGVPAREEEVVTSGQAAAELLAGDLPAGSSVLVVGTAALAMELSRVGLRPVTRAEEHPVAVVQGFGPGIGWADLAEACLAIRAGARWVATNTDATMPSPRGPVPGNGSMVAALREALGGRQPDSVVGKPEPALFAVASRGRRALVVGDRLDTDIEGANGAGMASLLVLTGVSTPEDLLRAPAALRPTYVAADCRALLRPVEESIVPRSPTRSGPWWVEADDGGLRLLGEGGDAVAALRALAAAAWANPRWSSIRGEGATARRALTDLGL